MDDAARNDIEVTRVPSIGMYRVHHVPTGAAVDVSKWDVLYDGHTRLGLTPAEERRRAQMLAAELLLRITQGRPHR